MSNYENAFETLATRGAPIGATALLERVELDLEDVAHLVEPPRRTRLSGLAVAAVVFAAVLAFGGLWALVSRQGDDLAGTVDQYGVEWIEMRDVGPRIMSITAGPGGFVRASFAGDGSGLEFSSDGRTWSEIELPGGSDHSLTRSPFATSETWLTVADDGDTTSAWISLDGRIWTPVEWPLNLVGEVVGSGTGFFAISRDVFGEGTTLWWSPDGAEWAETEAASPGHPGRASLWGTSAGIAWSPRAEVADPSLPIYHSVDGKEWIEGRIELPMELSEPPLRWSLTVVEYIGDRWIAIGHISRSADDPVSHVWTSLDGVEWAAQGSPEFSRVEDRSVRMYQSAVVDGRLVVAPDVLAVAEHDGIIRGQGPSPSIGEIWATADGAAWFRVLETGSDISAVSGAVTDDGHVVGLWLNRVQQSSGEQPVETTTGIVTPPQELDQAGLDLQDEILADGVVTEDELRRALEGWQSCMEERGYDGAFFEFDARDGWSTGYPSPYDSAGDAESAACMASYVTEVSTVLNSR